MSSGDYPHLWPETQGSANRSHGRHTDELFRRKHGPWHNAGGPGQPVLDPDGVGITPAAGYINEAGVRFRRQLGGGTKTQIAVDGGAAGDTVLILESNWYVFGEGKIPLDGHDSTGAYRAFYIDTSNGHIVIGV